MLAAISKFGIASSFDTLCQVAGELYPTPVRGIGTGFSSTVGDLGNIVMPYIILTAETYRMLPMIILGIFAAICGVTVLLLPETLDQCMPETLQEAEEGEKVGKEAFLNNLRRFRDFPKLLRCCCEKDKKKNRNRLYKIESTTTDAHL